MIFLKKCRHETIVLLIFGGPVILLKSFLKLLLRPEIRSFRKRLGVIFKHYEEERIP